ncbi:MAG: hypothetical protein KF718_12940 [Polyangiaceae bacterium]|nr:hypothetical protein [Polyangiaceae bacterium]
MTSPEFEQLDQLQAQFEASNRMLAEIWEALDARGDDFIPITAAELAAIDESCSSTLPEQNSNPTFGLRC